MSREDKQLFLKENIMDQEYDVNTFVEFMDNERSDGGNIDNWDMDSLEEAVNRFVHEQKEAQVEAPVRKEEVISDEEAEDEIVQEKTQDVDPKFEESPTIKPT